jgi:hypothetical protein
VTSNAYISLVVVELIDFISSMRLKEATLGGRLMDIEDAASEGISSYEL